MPFGRNDLTSCLSVIFANECYWFELHYRSSGHPSPMEYRVGTRSKSTRRKATGIQSKPDTRQSTGKASCEPAKITFAGVLLSPRVGRSSISIKMLPIPGQEPTGSQRPSVENKKSNTYIHTYIYTKHRKDTSLSRSLTCRL